MELFGSVGDFYLTSSQGGGFANSWRAMLAALEAKFAPNTAVAAALVKSGDAFLLDTSEALELDTEDHGQGCCFTTLLIVSQFFFFRLLPPPNKKSRQSWGLYISVAA